MINVYQLFCLNSPLMLRPMIPTRIDHLLSINNIFFLLTVNGEVVSILFPLADDGVDLSKVKFESKSNFIVTYGIRSA